MPKMNIEKIAVSASIRKASVATSLGLPPMLKMTPAKLTPPTATMVGRMAAELNTLCRAFQPIPNLALTHAAPAAKGAPKSPRTKIVIKFTSLPLFPIQSDH